LLHRNKKAGGNHLGLDRRASLAITARSMLDR